MGMQFQRIMLFVALGLTLMMIWQSWIEFQANYPGRQAGSGTTVEPTSGSVDLTEVPDAPSVQDVAEDSDSAEPVPAADAMRPETEVIRVSTDLVNAEIDLRGGDLVRVELLSHPVSIDSPDVPFVLMHRDAAGLFVAQSGLIGKDREYPNHNVRYAAQNTEYELGNRDSLDVAMNWIAPDGVEYQKTYRFTRDSYRVEVIFQVANRSETPWSGFIYGQLKQTEVESPGSMGILGRLPSYSGAAVYTEQDKYEKIDYGEIRDESLNLTTSSGWVSMMQHYFVAAWLPVDADGYQFYSGVSNTVNPQYRIGFKSLQPVTVAPGETGRLRGILFAGPKEQKRLDRQGAEGLKLTVDYGFLTPVANPLFWLLENIYSFTQNWGWAIILLTLLVKLVFYPLSATSYKSMAKMKKLHPRMVTLKERYSEDKQKFQQEMMKMYKAEKVNPAGGCLPILVQIPVFIALYWVLLESVELRQASFMGWLKDLSLPDPYFILPVIMGASMLAQHFLNPAPVDPLQKKIMLALPFVFTVFFLWFPAGLVLYWVVNNLLSIAQQYYITRKFAEK